MVDHQSEIDPIPDESGEPSALTVEVVHHGTICPIQKSRMEAHIQHLGVFTSSGSVLPATLDDRRHGTHLYQAADLLIYPEIEDASEAEVIYAGVFFTHYGHFLLESLSRLWYAKEHPELPIVWIGVDSWQSPPQLREWQRDILDVLGVHNPIRVLIRPERFATVHVPDAGYKYGDWFHPEHAKFLAASEPAAQVPGRKVWLSRSDVSNGIGIVNSSIIEESLTESGWTLMCPEKLPIREQLRVLAEAEEIAGEEGSAFHTLVLLKDISQKKFHVFRRHGPEHMSFHTIGDVRNVRQFFYSTGSDEVLSIVGRDVQRLAPNPAQVLNYLRVPIRRTSVREVANNPSVRRVGALIGALKARSYLEIGVRDGYVFNAVECERKVAVDTNFRFDTRNFAKPGTEFFTLSPEDFATYFAKDERFDLIFINNCHYFEEVLRVFVSCLPMTHPRSVFLIDNVFPVDAFSAMRDHEQALRFRHAQGNLRKAWHGDVYKAALLIRQLFPAWELSTIGTGGNAQALVRGRGQLARYHESITQHAETSAEVMWPVNLSYEALVERKQAMNFVSEEVALESVRSIE